jgi:hypothetical protein
MGATVEQRAKRALGIEDHDLGSADRRDHSLARMRLADRSDDMPLDDHASLKAA